MAALSEATRIRPQSPGGRRRLRKFFTLYLPLLLFLVVTLFPFYWMFITSIKTNPELINTKSMPLIVNQPTFEHYTYLFQQTNFFRWSFNSVLVTVVSTLVSLFCGVLAGYSIARLRFRGGGAAGLAIFVTYLVPQTLLFIPLVVVVNSMHLMDSLWAMM